MPSGLIAFDRARHIRHLLEVELTFELKDEY